MAPRTLFYCDILQECDYAVSKGAKYDERLFEWSKSFYCSVTLLRLLLTRTAAPAIYARITNLMDHSQVNTRPRH